jgi:hypothetical protein
LARPDELRDPGDQRMGAEGVALVDQRRLGVVALVEPRREQEVRGHVVVDEADTQDPDPPRGDERKGREQQGNEAGEGRGESP